MACRRSAYSASLVPSWTARAKRPFRFNHRRSFGKLTARQQTAEAYHAAEAQTRITMVMVLKRPSRRQRRRSGRVPLSPCRCHNAFHCFNSQAIGQRIR